MKLHDISMPIRATMPVWPGDPPVAVAFDRRLAEGATCNLSRLALGTHTGTHIDAPWHFLETGRKIGQIPLTTLIGPCRVIEVSGAGPVRRQDLEAAGLDPGARLLLKTENSRRNLAARREFCTGYVALALEAAAYLVDRGVSLLGIDYLSVEPFATDDAAVHRLLLGNNIVVLEGLDLAGVRAGDYELLCLPLNLPECEGAPARVLLREI